MLDLSKIKAPEIAMFVARNETICPYTTAENTRDIIGDPVKNFYTIEDQDHRYFCGANDDEFMTNLMSELVEPTVSSQNIEE